MFNVFYPYECADSVFTIDYDKLYAMGIRGLIFDIDNTLVLHGSDSTPALDDLFREVQSKGLSRFRIYDVRPVFARNMSRSIVVF